MKFQITNKDEFSQNKGRLEVVTPCQIIGDPADIRWFANRILDMCPDQPLGNTIVFTIQTDQDRENIRLAWEIADEERTLKKAEEILSKRNSYKTI